MEQGSLPCHCGPFLRWNRTRCSDFQWSQRAILPVLWWWGDWSHSQRNKCVCPAMLGQRHYNVVYNIRWDQGIHWISHFDGDQPPTRDQGLLGERWEATLHPNCFPNLPQPIRSYQQVPTFCRQHATTIKGGARVQQQGAESAAYHHCYETARPCTDQIHKTALMRQWFLSKVMCTE